MSRDVDRPSIAAKQARVRPLRTRTPTKKLLTVGQFELLNAPIPPFTIDYEKVRDLVVVVIYGFFLTAHVAMWSLWQDRNKRAEKRAQRELEPSTYGRPLVKQPG